MSDVIAELRLENHQLMKRIADVQEYLDNTTRESFKKYDVFKMLEHIKRGGGWI